MADNHLREYLWKKWHREELYWLTRHLKQLLENSLIVWWVTHLVRTFVANSTMTYCCVSFCFFFCEIKIEVAFIRKALHIWRILRQSANSPVLPVQFGTEHGMIRYMKLEISTVEFWDYLPGGRGLKYLQTCKHAFVQNASCMLHLYAHWILLLKK